MCNCFAVWLCVVLQADETTESEYGLKSNESGDLARGSIAIRTRLVPPDPRMALDVLCGRKPTDKAGADGAKGGPGGNRVSLMARVTKVTQSTAGTGGFLKRRSRTPAFQKVDWSHVKARTATQDDSTESRQAQQTPPSHAGATAGKVKSFPIPNYKRVRSRVDTGRPGDDATPEKGYSQSHTRDVPQRTNRARSRPTRAPQGAAREPSGNKPAEVSPHRWHEALRGDGMQRAQKGRRRFESIDSEPEIDAGGAVLYNPAAAASARDMPEFWIDANALAGAAPDHGMGIDSYSQQHRTRQMQREFGRMQGASGSPPESGLPGPGFFSQANQAKRKSSAGQRAVASAQHNAGTGIGGTQAELDMEEKRREIRRIAEAYADLAEGSHDALPIPPSVPRNPPPGARGNTGNRFTLAETDLNAEYAEYMQYDHASGTGEAEQQPPVTGGPRRWAIAPPQAPVATDDLPPPPPPPGSKWPSASVRPTGSQPKPLAARSLLRHDGTGSSPDEPARSTRVSRSQLARRSREAAAASAPQHANSGSGHIELDDLQQELDSMARDSTVHRSRGDQPEPSPADLDADDVVDGGLAMDRGLLESLAAQGFSEVRDFQQTACDRAVPREKL